MVSLGNLKERERGREREIEIISKKISLQWWLSAIISATWEIKEGGSKVHKYSQQLSEILSQK